MGRYILRRLVISIPLLFIISVIAFGLALAMPGDFIIATRPLEATQATTRQTYDHLRELHGLNKPPIQLYFEWMGQVVQGNLGYSLYYGDSVRDRIAERLPRTLELTVTALIIGIIFGVILGIIAALKEGSWLDNIITFLTFTWISVPVYVLGLFALYFLSLKVPLFPTGGRGPIGQQYSLLTHLHHLVLPALVLGLSYVAWYIRYVRNSVLETLQQDYVRTAQAKGLPQRIVLVRHALRNALIPLVTVVTLSLPGLFGGAVFIEMIFNWPGLASMVLQAVQQRDFPIVVGMNLVIATLVLLSNLLADIVYAIIDPRIRYN